MRRSARLAYCFLFTLAMILAWILRDFAKPLMEKLPCKFVVYLGLLPGLVNWLLASVRDLDLYFAICEQGLCTTVPTPVRVSMGSRQSTVSAWATL